jgi:hypothetical protein
LKAESCNEQNGFALGGFKVRQYFVPLFKVVHVNATFVVRFFMLAVISNVLIVAK